MRATAEAVRSSDLGIGAGAVANCREVAVLRLRAAASEDGAQAASIRDTLDELGWAASR